jgi:HK97 family phage major capsid protein
MPAQTDAMIARLENELEERNALIEGCIASAQDKNRDLNSQEMELIGGAKERITAVTAQLDPLREASKLAIESRTRTRQLNDELAASRTRANNIPGVVEYRSAGQYVADLYLANMGDEGAQTRTEVFHRAAAHQTTADNPGLLPENIVGPIVNFVDTARPIVAVIGPQDLGTGAWAYAKITQHTQVGVQAGEKTELASRKMTITKTPLVPDTYGGYVNVSRQDINRTSPAILDMVINDLAGQYAIQTEAAAAAALTAAAATGPVIPVTPTAANIATALWGAAGSVFAATKGQGRTVIAMSPDQLGIIGPIFPGINPQNAYSAGFDVSNLASGAQGAVVGLTVVMSAGLATDTILVFSTAAVNCFEARYGALQVVEPSVWGVQVGYAGDFKSVIVEPTAIVRVTTA